MSGTPFPAGAVRRAARASARRPKTVIARWLLFAMARLPDMKQTGVGLTVAVLLDATVRGVALPAAVALLGDRRRRPALIIPASVRSSDGR